MLFDAEIVKLDLCGIIIVYKINSFTQTAFLFLPQIPFGIDWTSIWHLLIRPDLLLRTAFNCSFLISPLPPSFLTSMVVGGSGIPLWPKSPAHPIMASPFPSMMATATIDV